MASQAPRDPQRLSRALAVVLLLLWPSLVHLLSRESPESFKLGVGFYVLFVSSDFIQTTGSIFSDPLFIAGWMVLTILVALRNRTQPERVTAFLLRGNLGLATFGIWLAQIRFLRAGIFAGREGPTPAEVAADQAAGLIALAATGAILITSYLALAAGSRIERTRAMRAVEVAALACVRRCPACNAACDEVAQICPACGVSLRVYEVGSDSALSIRREGQWRRINFHSVLVTPLA